MYESSSKTVSEVLTVAEACEHDSIDIWHWRNDLQSRLWSIEGEEVSLRSHTKWFAAALKNKDRFLYLGKLGNNQKIGVCRFDVDITENIAHVSINLNPAFRKQNLSSVLLKKSIELFAKTRLIDLRATIKKGNIASIKCFDSCYFIFDHEDNIYNYYRKNMIQSDDLKSKLKLIDEIEKIRTANNVNWMDLLRLAFTKAPEETKLLIRKINADDNKISSLFAKLGE
jgi:RimJ/RimL family protein N-acetyltransferase